MSLLDLTSIIDEVEDAQEPTIAKDGSEHKLRIVSVRSGIAGTNNAEYFSPVFEVIDAPLVKEFSDFFWVPDKEKLNPKQYARSLWDIRVFAKGFGIDLSRPLDYEDDLPGLTGWAILGTKTDKTYGEQNTIRKYILPAE
jgi:hypothetical protein